MRQLADHLKSLKVWVIPYNQPQIPWRELKGMDERKYSSLYDEWDWNCATGINLIVGKRGIRVMELHDRNRLEEALSALGLPEDYPWIIDSVGSIAIVVDTPNVSPKVFGMTNRGYEKVLLLWEGYYALPFTGIERYFYRNRFPTEHPKQVLDDVFINCIEEFS